LLGVFSLVGKVDGERVVRQCRSRGFELVINLKTAKSLDPELAPMLFVRPRGDRKTSADPDCQPGRLSVEVRCGSDSERLAMSTMGPLCPEQLTQEETLDEVCVGPIAATVSIPDPWTLE
jgi:hypothetical protein